MSPPTGIQIPLFGARTPADHVKTELLRVARLVVDRIGTKAAAAEMDRGASVLCHQLAERDRHRLSFDDFCALVAMDDTETFASAFCDLQGCEPPVRKATLDDSAKLERLLRSLAKAGPAGAAIVADALGEGK